MAKTMLTVHALCVGKLFVENLMEVASISGFELIARPIAKCRKYRSYKVDLQQFGHFACLYCIWVPDCARMVMAAAQHRRCNPGAADVRAFQMLLGCCVSRRNKRIFQWSSDKNNVTMLLCDWELRGMRLVVHSELTF